MDAFPYFRVRIILAGIPLRDLQRHGMAGIFGRSTEGNAKSIPGGKTRQIMENSLILLIDC